MIRFKKIFLFCLCICCFSEVMSRERYWVFFNDKEIASANYPVLQDRALTKRRLRGHADYDYYDVAVNPSCLARIKAVGCEPIVISRWLNAASYYLNQEQLLQIRALEFVKEIQSVKTLKVIPSVIQHPARSHTLQKINTHQFDYGISYTQVSQINVPVVHDLGFSGDGVLIGMIDTGFDVETHPVFSHLKVQDQYDFHWRDTNTSNEYNDMPSQHEHGTITLSIIGGFEAGQLVGPAFNATYVLAKTEWNPTETHLEEDHLVEALEWMYTLGVDIVSISLGYSTFDDGDDYTHADLDGNTAVTTRAADIAVKKGMLVLTSAGNERQSEWHYIMTPADGDSVLAIGAVDLDGDIGYLSSVGPTSDGRIKPDFAAMGIGTYGFSPGYNGGRYIFANGTSLSCPLVAGVCALMLEARPELTPMEIRDALRATSSQSAQPDTLLGWGIPDACAALFYHGPVFHPISFSDVISGGYTVSVRILTQDGSSDQHVRFCYQKTGDTFFTELPLQPEVNSPDLYSAELADLNMDNLQFYFYTQDVHGTTFTAPLHAPKQLYTYRVQTDSNISINPYQPQTVYLFQNYPNPFNAETRFMFDISAPAFVSLDIFNTRGRRVRRLVHQSLHTGRMQITWNSTDDHGRRVGSGLYISRLLVNGESYTRKLILSH